MGCGLCGARFPYGETGLQPLQCSESAVDELIKHIHLDDTERFSRLFSGIECVSDSNTKFIGICMQYSLPVRCSPLVVTCTRYTLLHRHTHILPPSPHFARLTRSCTLHAHPIHFTCMWPTSCAFVGRVRCQVHGGSSTFDFNDRSPSALLSLEGWQHAFETLKGDPANWNGLQSLE